MSNKLKKFIDHNRRDFDDELPSGKVWEQVNKTLPREKKQRVFSLKDIYKWTAAAAILCITLTSVYFLLIRKNSQEKTIVKVETSQENQVSSDDFINMPPEHQDEARKAYQVIQARQQELKSATSTDPGLYKQFSEDLGTLDSSYRVLKNQAGQTPNRELIIRAMLQNLQLQGELLSRQLMILHEFKNDKKPKDEKVS